MRGLCDNRQAARLVGIPVSRMVNLSFALSGMLGGCRRIVAPLVMGQYNMGTCSASRASAAPSWAAMGNPMGAVLGGLLLGCLESLGPASPLRLLRLQGRLRLWHHAAGAAGETNRPAGRGEEVTPGMRAPRGQVVTFPRRSPPCPLLAARRQYALGLVTGIAINAIVVLGLNLLMGYAGQVSLGQAAFVGIEAYTAAILTTRVSRSLAGAWGAVV